MELVDDESTLNRARIAWDQHRQSHGKAFDPHDIEAKLKGQKLPSKRPRAAVKLGILMIVLIGGIGVTLTVLSGNLSLGLTHEGRAQTPVAHNADWNPIDRAFNGVMMMRVPAGCFEMGSWDWGTEEQPVETVCFDEPFWIDQTEVTQAQFRQFRGVRANPNYYSGEQRPAETITWFEARDFCALRDARLPTEAEWEYAARGPDNLVYPWGNTFDANNAVFNSDDGTADVGTRSEDASWVGALDMSGNVLEWTSSLHLPYPYGDDHESDGDTSSQRIGRGGSYLSVEAVTMRGARRVGYYPDSTGDHVGFRCVRSDA
jgi:iron(II)-dependent oxidoreductase